MTRLSSSVAFLTLMMLAGVDQADCQRIRPVGVAAVRTTAPATQYVNIEITTTRSASPDTTQALSRSERAGVRGAGIGAIVFGTTGYFMGRGLCDSAGSHRGCITQTTAGGAVAGALIGYTIGRIIGNGL